jgi:hypothetical protein
MPRTEVEALGTEENPWSPDPRLRRAEVKQGTRESHRLDPLAFFDK